MPLYIYTISHCNTYVYTAPCISPEEISFDKNCESKVMQIHVFTIGLKETVFFNIWIS